MGKRVKEEAKEESKEKGVPNDFVSVIQTQLPINQ